MAQSTFVDGSLGPTSSLALPPLRSFTCFPNLPAELRLKIFQISMHQPRNVFVFWKEMGTAVRLATSPKPPAFLQVSKESRGEALKLYSSGFGDDEALPHFYFNSEVDTLCFDYDYSRRTLYCPHFSKFLLVADPASLDLIQRLKIRLASPFQYGPNWLQKFRGLRHLTLVYCHDLKIELKRYVYWKLKTQEDYLSGNQGTVSIEWTDVKPP